MKAKRPNHRERALARRMLDWVGGNVLPIQRVDQTPLEALCWYCAFQEATVYKEDETTKALAELLVDGHPGYKKLDDVAAYVDSDAEWSDIVAEMELFWGKA